MAKKNYTADEALLRLQEQCSISEKCVSEVRMKLQQWGVPSDSWDAIIQQLIIERYIDELRYARSFVRDKYKLSKWGELKIKNALYQKRIPSEIISEALAYLKEESIEEDLFMLLSKKLKNIKQVSLSDTFSKLLRFGVSRGFKYDEVYKVTQKLLKETPDDLVDI